MKKCISLFSILIISFVILSVSVYANSLSFPAEFYNIVEDSGKKTLQFVVCNQYPPQSSLDFFNKTTNVILTYSSKDNLLTIYGAIPDCSAASFSSSGCLQLSFTSKTYQPSFTSFVLSPGGVNGHSYSPGSQSTTYLFRQDEYILATPFFNEKILPLLSSYSSSYLDQYVIPFPGDQFFFALKDSIHSLKINYQYSDATQALPSYSGTFAKGQSFSIPTPVLKGYTPSMGEIAGDMASSDLTYTVTFTKIPELPPSSSDNSSSSGDSSGGNQYVIFDPNILKGGLKQMKSWIATAFNLGLWVFLIVISIVLLIRIVRMMMK